MCISVIWSYKSLLKALPKLIWYGLYAQHVIWREINLGLPEAGEPTSLDGHNGIMAWDFAEHTHCGESE